MNDEVGVAEGVVQLQDTVAVFVGPWKDKVPLKQPTVMVIVSPLSWTVPLAGSKVAPTSLLEVQFAPPSSSDSVTVHW